MRVDQFDFTLPPERIAVAPVSPRDAARLLHVRAAALVDRTVRDLPELLNPGDILVFNDSRVIPARLYATVGDRRVELLLHQPSGECWRAFARPARKLREGMRLTFAEDFTATVDGRTEDGQVLLRFTDGEGTLLEKLRKHGRMPLPPYIAREENAADQVSYQTVYARHDGSVAAPTAGLHFTQTLLDTLETRGVETAFVTLHVGAGTFQPVKVEDTNEHRMHREWCSITATTAEKINRVRAAGGKVIAVGTTSLRILETVATVDGTLGAWSGETDIFITPGYRFKIVDRLMTNFHLPKSTLFMLVSAFAGLERMKTAYDHAIAQEYRFYSYGDTSLLERAA